MEAFGFILLGVFIGACIMTVISIYSYDKSHIKLVDSETGDVYMYLGQATNFKSCNQIVMSTKDGHLEIVYDINESFEVKK